MKRKNSMKLEDFMKTEEFAMLPTVLDLNIQNNGGTGFKDVPNPRQVHFCNATACTDCHPYLIVKKTESEKTIWVVELDWEVVEGSCADGSAKYEYYVRMKDGMLDTTYMQECRKPRSKQKARWIDYMDGCYKYFLTDSPRYYYDPSF